MTQEQETQKLEYTKYSIGDKVDVFRDGKHWFRGLLTRVLDKGLILNPMGEPGGFNPDVLAGSYIPFNCEAVDYRFAIVQ